jgi:hypothetical protein
VPTHDVAFGVTFRITDDDGRAAQLSGWAARLCPVTTWSSTARATERLLMFAGADLVPLATPNNA